MEQTEDGGVLPQEVAAQLLLQQLSPTSGQDSHPAVVCRPPWRCIVLLLIPPEITFLSCGCATHPRDGRVCPVKLMRTFSEEICK